LGSSGSVRGERAVRRVENDPDLLENARLIRAALGLPEPDKGQHNVRIKALTLFMRTC